MSEMQKVGEFVIGEYTYTLYERVAWQDDEYYTVGWTVEDEEGDWLEDFEPDDRPDELRIKAHLDVDWPERYTLTPDERVQWAGRRVSERIAEITMLEQRLTTAKYLLAERQKELDQALAALPQSHSAQVLSILSD